MEDDPVAFARNRWTHVKAIAVFVIVLALFAVGEWWLIQHPEQFAGRDHVKAIAYEFFGLPVGIVILSAGIWMGLLSTLSTSPLIEVGTDGLKIGPYGCIPWAEVTDVALGIATYEKGGANQPALYVKECNYIDYYKRLPLVTRLMAYPVKRPDWSKRVICVRQDRCAVPLSFVVAAIEAHRPPAEPKAPTP